MRLNLDMSELEELSFQCIDGCALCCLCQPQLGYEDMGYWQGKDEVEAKDGEWFIRLKGDCGPCMSLVERRCCNYQHRPYVCRAFPFHLYAGWRLQVYADRSCRGITSGTGADGMAQELLDSIPQSVREGVIRDAMSRYHAFKVESNHRGKYRSPGDVRKEAETLIKEWSFNDLPSEGIKMARSVFEESDRIRLPIYVDRDLNWNFFQIRDDIVHHMILLDDGDEKEVSRVPVDQVVVPDLSQGALKYLRDYGDLLNSRDILYCEAARLCIEGQYQLPLNKIYLSLMEDVLMDLCWRSGLLMSFMGFTDPGVELVEELMVFYDWDFLDRDGVGLWL